MSICEGDSILIGEIYRSVPGTYTDILTNMFGCDSIVNKTLALIPQPNADIGSDTLSVCDGEELRFGIDTVGQNIESYTISNFITTVTNDSMIFIYDYLSPVSSVIIEVANKQGCTTSDRVVLIGNQILNLGQNFVLS